MEELKQEETNPKTPENKNLNKEVDPFKNDRNLKVEELKKLWRGFLSNKVQKEGEFVETTTKDLRTPHQRDYDKVIFSSSFRRLADKTQVFPLVKDVNIHTRLTHSLEVSTVGKTLARMLSDDLKNQKIISENDEIRAIEDIVATACLIHDIGNPPFGHTGEDALRLWWKDWKYDLKDHPIFKDFEFFEGNATGFRILKKKIPKLTAATMTSYCKYPRHITSKSRWKKNGLYLIDCSDYERYANQCGIQSVENESSLCWFRHPLTYFMEAADDICYCIVDVEDAYRANILSKNDIIDLKTKFYKHQEEKKKEDIRKVFNFDGQEIPIEKKDVKYDSEILKGKKVKQNKEIDVDIQGFRRDVIEYGVKHAWDTYLENSDAILRGTFEKTLIEDDFFKELKRVAQKKIYSCEKVIKIEVGGFKIINSLMNEFVNASLIYLNYRDLSKEQRRKEKSQYRYHVLKLLPKKWKKEIKDIKSDLDDMNDVVTFLKNDESLSTKQKKEMYRVYQVVLLISDYVSGMTDTFATTLYQNILGSSL